MGIKINHYAFNEGKTGAHHGCEYYDNPYDDGEKCNEKAALEWLKGWCDYHNGGA